MNRFNILLVVFILFLPNGLNAQISEDGIPKSFKEKKIKPVSETPFLKLSPLRVNFSLRNSMDKL